MPHVHLAAHDLLVARYVGRDVNPAEEIDARRLIETCDECAALEHDLRAISAAVSDAMPAWTSARRRDFRLTPEQAADLRRSPPERAARRWVEGLRARRLALLQPLAGATVALGLVMAVISSPVMATLNPTPIQDTMLAPAAVPAPEVASQRGTAPSGGVAPKLGEVGAASPGPAAGAGSNSSTGSGMGASDGGATQAGATAGPVSSPVEWSASSPAASSAPISAAIPAASPGATAVPAASSPLMLAVPPADAGDGSTAGGAGDQQAGVPGNERTSIAAETQSTNAEAGSASAPPEGSLRDAASGGSPLPVEPWVVWLIVAAAGAIVFVAMRVRRPSSRVA